MNESIQESGISFIADNVFHIENSPEYKRLDGSVKSVEFVRAKGSRLFFIEAKSSFPNPNNSKPNPDKGNKPGKELFDEEIEDISDKFTHSLNLYSAIDIGVIGDGFPNDYKPANKVSVAFILVINGFEISWCNEVEKTLSNKLRESISIARIWKPEILVINQDIAIKRRLAANTQENN